MAVKSTDSHSFFEFLSSINQWLEPVRLRLAGWLPNTDICGESLGEHQRTVSLREFCKEIQRSGPRLGLSLRFVEGECWKPSAGETVWLHGLCASAELSEPGRMDGKRWKGMSPNSKSTANSVVVCLWCTMESGQVCCIPLEMWSMRLRLQSSAPSHSP